MGLSRGYRHGRLPVTEDLSARILRLPNFADITEDDIAYVAGQVRSFLLARGKARVVLLTGSGA
jgi:dTDP-4-amino-4,6-dideoxygalactose transaminase